jgi:hypothetical protein
MRTGVLIVAIVFMLNDWGGQRHAASNAGAWKTTTISMANLNSENSGPGASASSASSGAHDSKARVDFDSQIKPILQSKCMPCHFSGGVMYVRLPFDRPETIKKLGTKLFTRIQDENHRRLIRDFLEQE